MARKVTAADVLNKAADIIEKRGWTQRVLQNQKGEVCLVGAINFALVGNSDFHRGTYKRIFTFDTIRRKQALRTAALICAASALPKGQLYGQSLPSYNDAPSRTKAQVISLLRRAAEKCKKNGS